MAFRYTIKKRVFGLDTAKSEKYVASSFSIAEIDYNKLCDQVTKEGMAPRGVVKMVMDGLIDALLPTLVWEQPLNWAISALSAQD